MKHIVTYNQESPFHISELFFSTTDSHGKITSWNDVFARISGYTDPEILLQPHSLIRHPDMPKAVFKLLWDTIEEGKVVGAYVKNRSKDGRYYWVYALVSPIDQGYLSIRFKPSSEVLGIVEALYRTLISYEQELLDSGVAKAHVAVQGKEKLLSELKSLGFEDYEAFIKTTLPLEIISREQQLRNSSENEMPESRGKDAYAQRSLIKSLEGELASLFSDLTKSLDLVKIVNTNFNNTHQFTHEIELRAMNATIEATRLGSHGATLYVLANYLRDNNTRMMGGFSSAEATCKQSLKSVSDIIFHVCVAKLQIEMLSCFSSEITKHGALSCAMPVDRLATLTSCFQTGIKEMAAQYRGIGEAFSEVSSVLEEIRKLFISLKIAHVSAKAEASRIPLASRFGSIFDEVNAIVENGQSIIDHTALQLDAYISLLRMKESNCQALYTSSQQI